MAFLGARLEPGFDLFARLAQLQRRLRSTGLVITGEGAIDPSTGMGKGVGEIARRCRRLNIPCVGLAGAIVGAHNPGRLFTEVRALTELTTVEQAKADARYWLEQLAATVAGGCSVGAVRRFVRVKDPARPRPAKA